MTENNTVALESFIQAEQPVKFPQLRRKNIIRLRGRVEPPEDPVNVRFRMLDGIEKPLFFNPPLAIPPVDVLIEAIATQGAVQFFVKFWRVIEITHYKLRSNADLENMVLTVLASSPDERISADDLHSPEIEAALRERGRDPRAAGAILASLAKQGIIKPTGERIRSVRKTCHNRPDLKMWTWTWQGRQLGT
jgi:hypothetical protein